MANITTLADDIAGLWEKEAPLTPELLSQLGVSVAMKAQRAFEKRDRHRGEKTLYASEVGKPCVRQVYYGYHMPGLAEPLPPQARTKFLYGDMLEDYVLTLAKAAGHDVTHEQTPITMTLSDGWVVKGRNDAVIDGHVVDVKSCSSYAYKKFQEGLNDYNDSFGYRTQLTTYSIGLPISYIGQGFLAIDKQNGHIGYFPTAPVDAQRTAESVAEALSQPKLPKRAFEAEAMGTSGNMKLPVNCSYCPFKKDCWSDANGGVGLRAFSYSTGPVFLTEVKKVPNVVEFIP
jgi:hypothetical protein